MSAIGISARTPRIVILVPQAREKDLDGSTESYASGPCADQPACEVARRLRGSDDGVFMLSKIDIFC